MLKIYFYYYIKNGKEGKVKFKNLTEKLNHICNEYDVDINDVEINITRLYPKVIHQDQNAILEINIEL